jgi:hypothetical protein
MEMLEDRQLLSVLSASSVPQTNDAGASSQAGIENSSVAASAASVTSNVLWQNQSTGLVGSWLIQNSANTGWASLGTADPFTWKVVGVGDFNGDGTPDVLWQNQSTGLVGIWHIQNNTNAGWLSVGTADPLTWKVVGVGDFNGDGTADVLWQNQSTGLVGTWLMHNFVNTGWFSLGTADLFTWKVAGVGDFNGDGTADVLWQNQSTGLVGFWSIQNNTNAGWLSLGSADPLTWQVAGVGDFNGDGTADVLWQNQSTGLTGTWLIENSASTGWFSFGTADPFAWQVAGVGDFNGDGTADVLWQNQSSGIVGMWSIQNAQNTGWTQLGQADPTQWAIVGVPPGQSGSPLLAASVVTAPTTGSASLTDSQLQPIISEAIARWTSNGLDAAALAKLAQVRFVIRDLPGSYLGEADGNRITIDTNAAGNGWFVDSTPALNEEFAASGSQQQLVAVDPRAVDRMDLLTVVEHELGHVVGLSDIYAQTSDLMNGVLGTGVRREPAQADAVLASY